MSRSKLISTIAIVVFLLSLFVFQSHRKSNEAKIDLGHYLFFEKRLSINGSKSCSSCHDPKLAFTDGYRRSIGVYADMVLHNAPSCLNLDTYQSFNWATPNVKTLEMQSTKPLFGQHPMELGLSPENNTPLNLLALDDRYKKLFYNAFGSYSSSQNLFTWQNVQSALAAYTAQLISRNSKYDNWKNGNLTALDESEKRGMDLFFSDRLGCDKCHGGQDFSTPKDTTAFYNIGLYQTVSNQDAGSDGKGAFRVPSLRNVALTSPYMHDGSVATLEECVKIKEQGGRVLNSGDGTLNTYKTLKIKGFQLSNWEKRDLILFLFTLTDTTYLRNPLFCSPF